MPPSPVIREVSPVTRFVLFDRSKFNLLPTSLKILLVVLEVSLRVAVKISLLEIKLFDAADVTAAAFVLVSILLLKRLLLAVALRLLAALVASTLAVAKLALVSNKFAFGSAGVNFKLPMLADGGLIPCASLSALSLALATLSAGFGVILSTTSSGDFLLSLENTLLKILAWSRGLLVVFNSLNAESCCLVSPKSRKLNVFPVFLRFVKRAVSSSE